MNASHLPDDVSRWPEDPYELLGVSPGVSPRELRRLYTRLIRIYKPEQFPEEFRRIREAYEIVLQYSELFGRIDAEGTPSNKTSEPPAMELPSPQPIPRPPAEDPEVCWEWACSGQEERAYNALVRLHERQPGKAEICLRLYWLLLLCPTLDHRSPCDWLVEGLLVNRYYGPLLELYREEITDVPEEAFTDRFTRLLDRAEGNLLRELLECRWQAAERLERWADMRLDQTAFRSRVLRDSEIGWVRLLLFAAARTAWTDEADTIFEACVREIDQHKHLGFTLGDELDRLDLLVDIAREWRGLQRRGGVPDSLLEVLHQNWTRSFHEIRPLVLNVLDQMCQAPEEWLRYLDTLRYYAPSVLASFGQVLDQYMQASCRLPRNPHDTEVVMRVASEFLDRVETESYRSYRNQLMRLCLREWISPEQLAEVTTEYPAGNMSLAQVILNDGPLRYIYRAYQLFWA